MDIKHQHSVRSISALYSHYMREKAALYGRYKVTMPAIYTNCLLILTLAVASCGSKGKAVRVAGFEIDSVVIDTAVALGSAADAPKCELSLHMHYLKDQKMHATNAELLRDGMYVADYLQLENPDLNVPALVDSFASRYLSEYRQEYGALYRSDTGHAASYNCTYRVHSHFEDAGGGIMNNIADIYTYGGGAHGIRQTIVHNIRTKDGSIVGLHDLFKADATDELKALITQQLCKQFKVKDLDELHKKGILTDGAAYVPENFLLTKKAVTFIYGEDEIAPHSVGEIRVSLSRSDLKKLMQ